MSRNVLDHGCGALNINAGRIRTTEDTSRTLGDTAYQLRKGPHGSAVTSGQGEAVDGSYTRKSRPDQAIIAVYLDAALAAKGMTKADLARETGLGTTVYSWWDKTRNRVPTPEQWPIIKKTLDLSDTHDLVMTEMVWVPRRNKTEGSEEGRWPANMILQHKPGCQRVGTRKVKGITGTAAGRMKGSPEGTTYGLRRRDGESRWSGGTGAGSACGYADPDGKETIAAWQCAPGCPVTELDGQSGPARSAGLYPSDSKGTGYSVTYGKDRTQGPLYADKGGASRFFKQVR